MDRKRWWFFGFALFYFFLALGTFRDYGITWDERDWYVSGEIYLKHFLGLNDPSVERGQLFSGEQASHNYFYPALARIFSHRMVPEQLHLFNLLFALGAYWVLFELLLDAFGEPWTALLGPVLLLFILRFSGDSAADPKDMPFAVLYTLGLAMVYFYRRMPWKPWVQDLGLGMAIAVAVAVRVPGFTLFPVFFLVRILGEGWNGKDPAGTGPWAKVRSEWTHWLAILGAFYLTLLILWPYLLQAPFSHLREIFHTSKDFNWVGRMLFMGREIDAQDKPWNYLPIWFLVTLPVLSIPLSVFSFYALRGRGEGLARRLVLCVSAAIAVNMGLVLVLRPVLYNGPRHFLFLYPLIALLAAAGAGLFWRAFPARIVRSGMVLALILDLGLVLAQWIRLYPDQYIYLNELVGGVHRGQRYFELDYWGASLKEASQWLARNEMRDPRRTYRVLVSENEWQVAYYLPDGNLVGRDLEKPDYWVHLAVQSIQFPEKFPITEDLRKRTVHEVTRQGAVLAYVFKMKP